MEPNYEQLKKEEENIEKFIPQKIGDVLKMKFPENPFLVEKLIPEKGITMISGQPGSGKSWVALHIIKCVASQDDVFGKFKTKKIGILLIDGDTFFDEISRRTKLMEFQSDKEIYIISEKNIKVDRPDDLAGIIKLIKEKGIGLVVLDPFIAFHNKDENISGEMNKVMECLKEITRTGVAVLVIHHQRKESEKMSFHAGQNVRGSSAIQGALDSQIEVKKDKNNPKEIMVIKHNKARKSCAAPEFRLKMTEENSHIYFDYIDGTIGSFSKRDKVETHILEILGAGEIDFESLFKEEIGGEAMFREVLKDIEQKGLIKSRKIERGKILYSKVELPAS